MTPAELEVYIRKHERAFNVVAWVVFIVSVIGFIGAVLHD